MSKKDAQRDIGEEILGDVEMSELRKAKKRVEVSVGESVRIVR